MPQPPFPEDFAQSARRHLRAAHRLCATMQPGDQPGCMAVAGYLFGLAGELALKEMMRDSGMRPRPGVRRRDNPFRQHFPEIKTLLRNMASGRRQQELAALANDAKLFEFWDTEMRYGRTNGIKEKWIPAWQKSAEQLVARMGL